MDFEAINNTIKTIEINLESIKDQMRIFENQKRLEQEKENVFDTGSHRKLENARLMKEIYSLIASGLTSWEVAEAVQGAFPSVWDAYYFITHCLRDERARKKYALHFLVYALAQNGFSNVKISKIAGYSPQRCGQILKKAVF